MIATTFKQQEAVRVEIRVTVVCHIGSDVDMTGTLPVPDRDPEAAISFKMAPTLPIHYDHNVAALAGQMTQAAIASNASLLGHRLTETLEECGY